MKQPMHITIVRPRLDIPFKDPGTPPPSARGPIAPIRQHWLNFAKKLKLAHENINDHVAELELPGWEITFQRMYELSKGTDIIYLPHRQKFDYPIDNARFYMQTVFPEFFTIDDNGWGAFLSYLPMQVEGVEPDMLLWKSLQERIKHNVSKFDQPVTSLEFATNLFKNRSYWLFVCQIPHDQVIIQSSSISVFDALNSTIEMARSHNKKLIVKGHPVNPGAMSDLRNLTHHHNDIAQWVENEASIHSLLENCSVAFMVNSGVGFEAMLHEKPIVTFGNSEYKEFVNFYTGPLTGINMDSLGYKKFMTAYFNKLFYTGD